MGIEGGFRCFIYLFFFFFFFCYFIKLEWGCYDRVRGSESR